MAIDCKNWQVLLTSEPPPKSRRVKGVAAMAQFKPKAEYAAPADR